MSLHVTRKNLPKSVVELVVEIPPERTERFFAKAVGRLAAVLALPGFRKGKVPPPIAEEHIQSRDLFEEASELMVRETYGDALRAEGLDPIGKPEVEVLKIARKEAFSYRIRVAVLPDVVLPDYRKFRVRERPLRIEEKELEDAIRYLRKARATFAKVAREARRGDLVEVDFALREHGVILEGGSETHQPFILGEGRLVPGFEEAVIGMREGEEKKFSLEIPPDYRRKDLAGKKLDCEVRLHALYERSLPELTDEFAQSLGKFESVEALKSSVAEGLLKEKRERERIRAEVELVTHIAEKTKTEFPDALIEREIGKMFAELESHLAAGGVGLEAYLAHLKKNRGDLEHDWRPEAEKRVKIALVLRAVAKREELRPAPEEVDARAQDMLAKYRAVKDAGRDYSPEELREYAENVLTNEKAFAHLRALCITKEDKS